MPPAFISFLSDYGLADAFVGTCHAVIAGICPTARVLDLTHGIPRHDVRTGALTLADALGYLPVGVHLAVVDPGVGGARRAVAVACRDGRMLVGPDNGLLHPAAEAAGGARGAVDIGHSPFCRRPVSATFHGRDIFAPVAARLAGGAALEQAGEPLDPASLTALALISPRRDGDVLVAAVRSIDGFGNLQLNSRPGDLAVGPAPGAAVTIGLPDGSDQRARYGGTFGDVAPGELLLFTDSQQWLALALHRDSAADRLGLELDAIVRIAP